MSDQSMTVGRIYTAHAMLKLELFDASMRTRVIERCITINDKRGWVDFYSIDKKSLLNDTHEVIGKISYCLLLAGGSGTIVTITLTPIQKLQQKHTDLFNRWVRRFGDQTAQERNLIKHVSTDVTFSSDHS